MVIGFVVDSFDDLNNGTTCSARRFIEHLRARGHVVRVLTAGEPGPDKYVLQRAWIPLVTYFADKQHITFAKPDAKTIEAFLDGVDVVHFYMPFPLARVVEKAARARGIPCLAAFHIQAENISYNIGLGRFDRVARFFYGFLRRYFFERFADIHCPSAFIAGELRKNGYQANLHVISNGVDEVFRPMPPVPHERFRILMIGRLSPEKRQDLVIRAALLSKHRDEIELHFAGQGPSAAKYRKMAEALPVPATFGFYSTEELLKLIASTDLYVHASDVEIEAISCMEAFSCGLVPVISDSPKSATPQFALDDRSLFRHGDSADLAAKIDWWIEHPAERAEMSPRYAEQGERYRVTRSVERMVEVYRGLKPGRPRA